MIPLKGANFTFYFLRRIAVLLFFCQHRLQLEKADPEDFLFKAFVLCAILWQEMKAHINPSGILLRLSNIKPIDTVLEGKQPNLFDNWADTSLHLSFY